MIPAFVRRVRRKLFQQLLLRTLVRKEADDLVRLGSEYGGWWVPTGLVGPGATVISAGVGEDTTFDEELLARGCEVWGIDPTPRAREHVRDRALGDRFHFLPVGLWSSDATLRFYAPADPTHVSHSILNVQQSSTWFEAECWSLPRVMQEAGLTAVDVLKLDIEGAEIDVIRGLLADSIRPEALCVELDAPLPERRTLGMLRELRNAGYRLARVEGWNLLLVKSSTRDREAS